MATKVGDIFVALGFKSEGLSNFQSGIRNVRNEVFKLTGVLTVAGYAINKFAQGAAQLANFTITTGLMSSKLQQYQVAGQLSNIAMSADEVSSSIVALQNNITQIRLGGGNLRPFQLLGISVQSGDAFKVIEQVRERIKGLDPSIAANLVQEMGLSPNFINLLRLSRKEFDELAKTGTRSSGVINALIGMGTQLRRLTIEFGLFRDRAIASMGPAIIGVIDFFRRLIGHIEYLANLWDKFAKTAPKAAQAIKVAFAGLAIALAIAFAPITALVTGLLLLFDDIMVYMRGGKSVIGTIADFMTEKSENAIGAIFDGGKKVKNAIGGLFGKKEPDMRTPLGSMVEMGAPLQSNVFPKNPDVNTTFNNNFTINSSGDPQAVGDTISKTLQKQMNYSVDDFNNGALY